MAGNPRNIELSNQIRGLLEGLRWRIRAYVWAEGIALALMWLGLMFWAGLAVDYLPVLVGASEMPRGARAFLLLVIAGVLAFILYRWIFRRTFVQLGDRSMAVLLERRYGAFHDSLVTAVEMSEHPDHAGDFNPDMLHHTSDEALGQIDQVRLNDVFRFSPLVTKLVVAIVLIVPIGVFAVAKADAFSTWLDRLLFLKDRPWDRYARIEVVGVDVQRSLVTDTLTPPIQSLTFDPEKRRIKVAKGSHVSLKVRAAADAEVVPPVCTVRYRQHDGETGSVTMAKIGGPRDGFQPYSFDGKPFKGILSTLTFDVIGYDHRVRDFGIEVVDSPAVVDPEVYCEFPPYMVDEQLSLWLPRTLRLESGLQLPKGTKLTIRGRSNKEISEVRYFDVDAKETKTVVYLAIGEEAPWEKVDTSIVPIQVDADGRHRFGYHVPSLDKNLSLDVTLIDRDNVIMERPHRFLITAVSDQPPRIDVVLRGISTMVTPRVLVPAKGKITDDYGVAKAWFRVVVNDEGGEQFPLAVARDGAVAGQIDFRQLATEKDGIELAPKNKLLITVEAEDRYNLGDKPNLGVGDRYQLDVVTDDELLAALERRELGLRRRFEQIIEEVTGMRDSLVRVKSGATGSGGDEPEDKKKSGDEPGDKEKEKELDAKTKAQREQSLKQLRVQEASLQSDKSMRETLGVAEAFESIREELINNRVDTEDRKERLKEKIADPLRSIAQDMFPELQARLKKLEERLKQGEDGGASAAAVQQADDILIEMDKVLKDMVDLETFKELLSLIRGLIEEHDRVMKETEKTLEADPLGLE